MHMPRAVKGLLQFVFGLVLMCAFLYPRMWPLIRQSRAISKARSSAPFVAQPRGQGSGPSKSGAPLDRIASFASDVTLRKDSTLDVREEFVVHSEGDYFHYGMVRDLPIDSEARWDRQLSGPYAKDTGIRVKILEISEDGTPVDYEQGSDAAYQQLRIAPWQPLALGDHRFVVHYEADGVTQFLAERDQLYWNAVGHYWRLPVDDAVVRLHLPPEVPAGIVTAQAYAGGRGANLQSGGRFGGKQVQHTAIADGFEFRMTNLGTAQSISVSLDWPKGFLMPPALGPLAHDGWLLIAPALLLLYYLIVWLALGRQPQRGTIAIQYQPPQGLSPAAMRFIRTTGCDGRTLAATIAQLAARGCINVEPQNGKYKVTRLSVDPKSLQPPLAAEEMTVLQELFDDGPAVVLDPRNGNPLNRYLMQINIELQKGLSNLYFTRNARWLALGTLASLLTAIGMALTAHGRNTDLMPLLFLTWWFFFCFFLLGLIAVMTLLPALGRMMRGLGGAKEVLIGTAVIGAFGVGGVAVLWQMKSAASPAYAVSLAALVAINIAAFPALKRLTPLGRQTLEQIEGFRMFLEKVEQDRLQRLSGADGQAGAAFEFMPYAIALEVREAWGDHLAEACVVVTTTR
jgi:predicted membrane protein DUF2207